MLESEVTVTGATSFQEVGTIAFGAGHRLRFATVGSGYLGAGPDPARRHGAVTWRVEGGEGRFAGARGLITANVLVGADLAVTAHHLGVLFVPEGVASRQRWRGRKAPPPWPLRRARDRLGTEGADGPEMVSGPSRCRHEPRTSPPLRLSRSGVLRRL